MVKLNPPFVNIVNFTQQFVKFDIHVKGLFKLVFDSCVLSQKCLKVHVEIVTLKENNVVNVTELNGDCAVLP